MPTIGSRRHAAMALFFATSPASLRSDEDWKTFVDGSCRSVYLHIPTGVVYKVDRYFMDGYDNESEYRNAKALARMMWHNVYIPKVSIFRFDEGPVLAMEYIEGELGQDMPRGIYPEGRQEFLNRGRMTDMHGQNFKFLADGTFVPIDMGSDRVPRGADTTDEGEEIDNRLLHCGDGSWGW